MLRPATIALALALLSACETAPPPEDPTWQPMRFLVGAWRSLDGAGSTLEVWTEPHGMTMYGQNRIVRDGAMASFELLSIELRGDTFVYVARPRGGPATEFPLKAQGPNSVTFVNPEHDFPKRIHYELSADGNELVAVADANDGGDQRIEFRWSRVR
ncbi:MAG: hypothetical protein KAI24_07285 [Planctomycetes bacterium]|nr:hypothetical protein [Planctomycetota bacterium]